jgi:hypothetical protein
MKLFTLTKLSHLKQTLRNLLIICLQRSLPDFFAELKSGEELRATPMYVAVTFSECWEYFPYLHPDTVLWKCVPFKISFSKSSMNLSVTAEI